MKKMTGSLVAVLVFACGAAMALDAGRATGSFETPSGTIEVFHAAARLQPTIFDDGTTEIEIILSDLPVSSEDLEDDTIAFEQGYMSVRSRDGRIAGFTLHVGYSELGSGGGVFEGKISDDSVSGRYHSDGSIDIMDTLVSFDTTFSTEVYSVIRPPFTEDDAKAARSSDLVSIYEQYLRAEDGEQARPFMCAALVRQLDEESYGMIGMIRSDVSADDLEPLQVAIDGDSAVLYAKASDQEGTIRFAKEDGAWKIRKETWRYTY